MPTRREAIATFLKAKGIHGFDTIYTPEMECQVNCARDNGEPIEGEFRGRNWKAWTDGVAIWKSFRIPYNAATEPTYDDVEMKFDLAKHVEGIGLTGWNWVQKVSKHVAFDFDAITGHSERHARKLDENEIARVIEEAKKIPWVQIRRSASGNGLHLYVFLDDIPTKNHTEHAALARAVLGMMSALTGFNFESRVDICGANIWIWNRKQNIENRSFEIIKEHTTTLNEVPNWESHIRVTTNKSRRTLPTAIPESNENAFDEITGQYAKVPLEPEHKKLIDWLVARGQRWWFDSDRWLLVTHTSALAEAHKDLGFRGEFKTISKGGDRDDHNCFLNPMYGGYWSVRRFGPGTMEAPTWSQDASGWTRCFYNKEPNFEEAMRAKGAVEMKGNAYQFQELETATHALSLININMDPPKAALTRPTKIKEEKGGKVLLEIDAQDSDQNSQFEGWARVKNKWQKVIKSSTTSQTEVEIPSCDEHLRHMIGDIDRKDQGWAVNASNAWQLEPFNHIKPFLKSLGYELGVLDHIIGSCISRAWKIVNKPFQPEYTGDREWNKGSAQLRFTPSVNMDALHYPTWQKILNHVGKNLDYDVKNHPWAKLAGISTGGDYLKCWVASMFQNPYEPLPYLFLYGPQDCGKSMLREALSLLMTQQGVMEGRVALESKDGFNAELATAVLCYIEEVDLNKSAVAYNRIKDWVTARTLTVHEKHVTPYQMPNTTHWIQCANDKNYCPIFPGDTRITVIRVDELDPIDMIPKIKMEKLLQAEAPDFLAAVMNLELPEPESRLYVPVIETQDKVSIENTNESLLAAFIKEHCYKVNGETIVFAEFCDRFYKSIPQDERSSWSKHRIRKEFPGEIPIGTMGMNVLTIGNLTFESELSQNVKTKLIVGKNGRLIG